MGKARKLMVFIGVAVYASFLVLLVNSCIEGM